MKKTRWTKDQDATLSAMWRKATVAELADYFMKSESAILHRARSLKLKSRNSVTYENRKAVYAKPSMPFVNIGRD